MFTFRACFDNSMIQLDVDKHDLKCIIAFCSDLVILWQITMIAVVGTIWFSEYKSVLFHSSFDRGNIKVICVGVWNHNN